MNISLIDDAYGIDSDRLSVLPSGVDELVTSPPNAVVHPPPPSDAGHPQFAQPVYPPMPTDKASAPGLRRMYSSQEAGRSKEGVREYSKAHRRPRTSRAHMRQRFAKKRPDDAPLNTSAPLQHNAELSAEEFEKKKNSNRRTGFIIIGVIMLVLIIVCIVVLVLWRKKKRNTQPTYEYYKHNATTSPLNAAAAPVPWMYVTHPPNTAPPPFNYNYSPHTPTQPPSLHPPPAQLQARPRPVSVSQAPQPQHRYAPTPSPAPAIPHYVGQTRLMHSQPHPALTPWSAKSG